MKNAGDLVLLDVDFPLPVKLLILAALVFLLLGPVGVYRAARGGHPWRGAIAYLGGAAAVAALLMVIEWGPVAGDNLRRGLVLFRYVGSEVLMWGATLCALALAFGMRKRPGSA